MTGEIFITMDIEKPHAYLTYRFLEVEKLEKKV
jgi:hypothetical protein